MRVNSGTTAFLQPAREHGGHTGGDDTVLDCLKKVFGLFSRQVRRMGMDLSIARTIVEARGGRLTVKAEIAREEATLLAIREGRAQGSYAKY